MVLPLSSSMDDGEEVNNASGGGIGSGAAAAVDDEDGVQWRWTMKIAFNGGGSVRR